MADIIVKIKSNDEYNELYKIATKIRNQNLITSVEKQSIVNQSQELSENEIGLLTSAWQSSNWNILYRQLKNQPDRVDVTIVCRLLNEINKSTPDAAHRVLGYHYATVGQLAALLYNEPSTVAAVLNNYDRNDISSNDTAIQVFFHMLYSCGMYQEDELRLAQVVCELLKIQLFKANSQMRTMLRKETSISTRFYKMFVESSHPTTVYLTAALRRGILAVIQLGSFWLDIDEKQSTNRFMKDKKDASRLPEYRALVVSKLVEIVDIFLEEIHNALALLPAALNWIVRDIFCTLHGMFDDDVSVELSHACKDMIVSNMICPAIISPQKLGIVNNDLRMGTIVNHNLVQIAMIVQMISLQEFGSTPNEYQEFLSQCRMTHLIPLMMDTLLMEKASPDVEMISKISSSRCKPEMPPKSCFVGSVADLNSIIRLVKHDGNKSHPDLSEVIQLCNKLPATFNITKPQASTSPKLSKLQNLQKKVQETLKKSDSFVETEDIMENNCFEKDNFDLFYLNYDRDAYDSFKEEAKKAKETVSSTPEPSTVEVPEVQEENDDIIEMKPTKSDTPPVKSDSRDNLNSPEVEETLIDVSVPDVAQVSVEQPDAAKRGLAKLKSFGDFMKKGITQSNTLSDIRGHLRRSAQFKQESPMPNSFSDQNLANETLGPRNDILAKYAATGSPKITKGIFESLIQLDSGSKEASEPYYSDQNLTGCRAFKDTLRKLVTVLGNMSYFPRINCREQDANSVDMKAVLDKFLGGVLVEAEHRREYGQAAQLREVKRCIEFFDSDGVRVLMDHLLLEVAKLEEKVAEIREERVSLMRKTSDLSDLRRKIQSNQELVEQNLIDCMMRRFIENGFSNSRSSNQTVEVRSVLKFYDEFKIVGTGDEKAECLNNLLTFLRERLLQNADWNYATENMINQGIQIIERYMMNAIYEIALRPNGDVDKSRDTLIRMSISKISQDVQPSNDFLKIPERLLGEAPWPSAQAELALLDMYVTAQDKLNCVVRCCDVINNLIALCGTAASADDLTPVLVFVVIKSNPRHLLSNVQFVETYAPDKIETGRDAYYWTNFKSAIEYIKTIL